MTQEEIEKLKRSKTSKESKLQTQNSATTATAPKENTRLDLFNIGLPTI